MNSSSKLKFANSEAISGTLATSLSCSVGEAAIDSSNIAQQPIKGNSSLDEEANSDTTAVIGVQTLEQTISHNSGMTDTEEISLGSKKINKR